MKDQISALVDDELPAESAEYLLAAIRAGGSPGESWTAYHLIGDVMRSNPVFKPDFTARVLEKLDEEPTVLAPKAISESRRKLPRPSPLWSIAASVAAVMFVGWMVLQQQTNPAQDSMSQEIAQNLPAEYLLAHQANAPSSTAYYIQPASYSENAK